MFLAKLKSLFLIFLVVFGLTSCTQEISQSIQNQKDKTTQAEKINKTKKALSLALEANLKYQEFKISCGYWSNQLTSKFVIIPLKKDVIQAAIAYKAAIDNLTDNQAASIEQEHLSTLLNSGKTTFIFIVINNKQLKYGEEILVFDSIKATTKLVGKNNKSYGLIDFSSNFSTPLSAGWNEGYLEFENFRKDYSGLVNTYSVQFTGYNMKCGDPNTARIQQFSFAFDESQINYLALIEQGLSENDIKERYVSTTYETVGISEQDVLSLVKFCIKLL